MISCRLLYISRLITRKVTLLVKITQHQPLLSILVRNHSIKQYYQMRTQFYHWTFLTFFYQYKSKTKKQSTFWQPRFSKNQSIQMFSFSVMLRMFPSTNVKFRILTNYREFKSQLILIPINRLVFPIRILRKTSRTASSWTLITSPWIMIT